MKFKLSFKLHSDLLANGTRYITEIPGLVSIKADANTLAFLPLYKDNASWLYCPSNIFIVGFNNVDLVGDGKTIKIVVNDRSYTIIKERKLDQVLVSGFSTTNYYKILGGVRSINNATYEVTFNTGTIPNTGTSTYVLHAPSMFHVGYRNDHKDFGIWNWGTGEIVKYVSGVKSNTNYTVKVTLNNPTVTYEFREEGELMETYTYDDSGLNAHPGQDFITVGNHTQTSQSWSYPFPGIMNFNKLTISIGGEQVFSGNLALEEPRKIYSGFSSSNYLLVPAQYLSYDPNDNVEYEIAFTTPSSFGSNKQQILHCGQSCQLYFSSNSNVLKYWNKAESTGYNIKAVDCNKKYWVKFSRINKVSSASISEDGQDYETPITSTDTNSQLTIDGYIGRFDDNSEPRPYQGSIDLNYFKVKVNGVVTIDGSNATDISRLLEHGSLTKSSTILTQVGSPTVTYTYSGDIYPEITTGSLKLYQSWLNLKDIEAIRYEDSDESDEPIIENLIYRRGSTASNIQLIIPFSPATATSWELKTQFMSTTSLSTWTDVVKFSKGSSRVGVLEHDVNHGQIQPFLSSNGSSWDIVQTDTIMSTFYPQVNTWYDIKLGFTGSYYYLETKLTTDDNFTRNLTCNTTTKMYGSDIDIFLINATTAQTKINLAKTLLTADNTVIFDGSHSQENVNYINNGCLLETIEVYDGGESDLPIESDEHEESNESDVNPQPTRVVSYTSTSANSTYLELTEVVPFNTADTWQVDLDITYNTTKNGETINSPHCFFGSSTTRSFNDTMDFLKEAMGPRSYLSNGSSLTGIGQINASDASYLVNGDRYILRLVFDGSSYKMYGKKQGESEFTQLGSTVYSSTKIASTATAWMFKAGYNDNYGCEDTLWCENSKIIINGQTWLDFSTAESEGKLINHGCTVVTE